VINSPVNIHFSGVGREDGSHVVPMEIHPRDRDVLSARRNDHPIAGVDRIAEFKADLPPVISMSADWGPISI
jgi:hypothetical protein